jgi:hypothetical protein
LALPVIMTEGPRWNTHALIGRIGPLIVQHSLEVQTSLADASAHAWSIVVYSFPNHQTVASLQRGDGPAGADGASLSLSKGRYCLILRYYEPLPAAKLPAVTVDGRPHVPSLSVPQNTNEFYRSLSSRRSLFYVILHYHAFVMLKYRRWLPRSLVERMYLPVGNPETHFRYGALAKSDGLRVSIAKDCLDAYDVYVTVYDLASFPLFWERLDGGRCEQTPFGQRCTFLIRLHPKSPDAPAITEGDVQVTVSPAQV